MKENRLNHTNQVLVNNLFPSGEMLIATKIKSLSLFCRERSNSWSARWSLQQGEIPKGWEGTKMKW